MAAVVWSTLSGEYLREHVLGPYALPEPVDCRYWTRDLNDVFLVRAADARYVLRLSGAGRRTEAARIGQLTRPLVEEHVRQVRAASR